MKPPATFKETVDAFISADRAYNADCNLRWEVKADKQRRLLRAASRRAYKRMVREITNVSAGRR